LFSQFQHILLPLDFTERNDSVLSAAHDIAAESNARISLIHVVEPLEDTGDSTLQSFTQRLTNEAEEKLRKRANQFEELGNTIVCENRVGKRNAEIVSYAIDQNVDLILLNSHPITPETPEASMFSLSYQVALLAPCAVLLLKP